MPERVYFKNLHGFRFFAAALVMLSHIELFKKRVGLPHLWNTPIFFEAGSAGVDFFFVLSGFLITALLLKEQQKTGKIALRKFYMRRILRIWPLYYTIIIVCYFIAPYLQVFYIAGYSEIIFDDFTPKLLYSLFFMPNVALSFFYEIPYAAPLWSVGVEEQFYLFWPLLLLMFKDKLRFFIIFIIGFIGLKVGFVLYNAIFPIKEVLFESIKNFLVSIRMECMGIGGLGAWLWYKKHSIVGLFKSNLTLAIASALLLITVWFAKYLFDLHHIVLAVLFLVFIVNGATNTQTPIKLENKLFLVLGNISYGLYLWHGLCIGLVINLIRHNLFFTQHKALFNLILYAGTFVSSILIAWLSYRFFETPFLKLKGKYSVIVSGTAATELAEKTNNHPVLNPLQ